MEFMLIMLNDRDSEMDPSIIPEMGKFAGELVAAGKGRGGARLHPETDGGRIRGGAATIPSSCRTAPSPKRKK